MSTRLQPLPDRDPLTADEVAAALGMSHRHVIQYAQRGQFLGAFQTPGLGNGPGMWRIPRAAALAAGRQMGLWS